MYPQNKSEKHSVEPKKESKLQKDIYNKTYIYVIYTIYITMYFIYTKYILYIYNVYDKTKYKNNTKYHRYIYIWRKHKNRYGNISTKFRRKGRKWDRGATQAFIIISIIFLYVWNASLKASKINFQCFEVASKSISCKLFYSVLISAYCFQKRLLLSAWWHNQFLT